MLKYCEIYDAFDARNSSFSGYDCEAYINVETEEIVCLYPVDVCDEEEEREEAEKKLETGDWIELPSKYDLDLGKKLVFRFAEKYLSLAEQDSVAGMFHRPGAYGRWRNFLDRKGITNDWYKFRDEEEEKALKNWLNENEIPFSDEKPEPEE